MSRLPRFARAASHSVLVGVTWPARWEMWRTGRPGWLVYALLSELGAVVLTVLGLVERSGDRSDLLWFGILLVLGVAQAEMSSGIERVRRWLGGQTHINVTSVWYLAGAVLLDPGWVGLLSAALYFHLWFRVWRHVRGRPAHRIVASTAWAVLSCLAASYLVRAAGLGGLVEARDVAAKGAVIVLVAAVVFEVVNAVVVSAGISLYTNEHSVADLLGTWEDNVLELVTLCLGGLTALALVYQPILVILVFPPLVLLHRHVLLKQLEVAAATDEKTGLLNTTGWHRLANRELARVDRKVGMTLGVLMVDLDHFKRVNDTYGHLAGDVVLKEVATTITAAVRDYDSVGRFGGEEFVVLLPDIAENHVVVVAERVREAIASLVVELEFDGEPAVISGLSASIGVATYPEAGTVVDRLVASADAALYQAKSSGRNKVVSGG
jgi:diguanylate cyclase (GGDEF)-like protein